MALTLALLLSGALLASSEPHATMSPPETGVGGVPTRKQRPLHHTRPLARSPALRAPALVGSPSVVRPPPFIRPHGPRCVRHREHRCIGRRGGSRHRRLAPPLRGWRRRAIAAAAVGADAGPARPQLHRLRAVGEQHGRHVRRGAGCHCPPRPFPSQPPPPLALHPSAAPPSVHHSHLRTACRAQATPTRSLQRTEAGPT